MILRHHENRLRTCQKMPRYKCVILRVYYVFRFCSFSSGIQGKLLRSSRTSQSRGSADAVTYHEAKKSRHTNAIKDGDSICMLWKESFCWVACKGGGQCGRVKTSPMMLHDHPLPGQ